MACTDDGAPYSGTRKRTFNLLVNTALALFEQGAMPSVSELAAEAGVSRATAYRYFPTQSDLIAATVDASLGPILTGAPTARKPATAWSNYWLSLIRRCSATKAHCVRHCMCRCSSGRRIARPRPNHRLMMRKTGQRAPQGDSG